jgi:hypothetical protein
MAHQRCMHHSLCRANDARFQQSRKVVLIFSSAKKEKRNCNQSFILLGSLTIPLRRRIGKSDHRQTRVLSPLCLLVGETLRFCIHLPWWEILIQLIKRSAIAKIRQKDLGSYLYQDGWENLMIVKPVRVLSSVSLCVKLGIHLSWWEISIQLTIYNTRITVCRGLRVQDCLNNQEKYSFLFGNREHCVIAIILKSHFIFLLGSVITQYTTAQPNREQTAAILSLSFSSKDVRNW